jgi:hypothetical protein
MTDSEGRKFPAQAFESLLPSFRPIFWQSKVNNQPLPVIVSVVAFPELLGELLPGLSHLLQFLAMSERGRPRHIATFGGIATVFFDSFQGNSSNLRDPGLVHA